MIRKVKKDLQIHKKNITTIQAGFFWVPGIDFCDPRVYYFQPPSRLLLNFGSAGNFGVAIRLFRGVLSFPAFRKVPCLGSGIKFIAIETGGDAGWRGGYDENSPPVPNHGFGIRIEIPLL